MRSVFLPSPDQVDILREARDESRLLPREGRQPDFWQDVDWLVHVRFLAVTRGALTLTDAGAECLGDAEQRAEFVEHVRAARPGRIATGPPPRRLKAPCR